MYKFRCDDLFENGYIGVRNGKIEKLNVKKTTNVIDKYINSLIGNDCLKWSKSTKKYFDWHFKENNLERLDR